MRAPCRWFVSPVPTVISMPWRGRFLQRAHRKQTCVHRSLVCEPICVCSSLCLLSGLQQCAQHACSIPFHTPKILKCSWGCHIVEAEVTEGTWVGRAFERGLSSGNRNWTPHESSKKISLSAQLNICSPVAP